MYRVDQVIKFKEDIHPGKKTKTKTNKKQKQKQKTKNKQKKKKKEKYYFMNKNIKEICHYMHLKCRI